MNMASRLFPGLPPYLDDAASARNANVEAMARIRDSWTVRQVSEALGSIAELERRPGDHTQAMKDILDRVADLVEAQQIAIEAQVCAGIEIADSHGLDASRFAALAPATQSSDPDASKQAKASKASRTAAKAAQAQIDSQVRAAQEEAGKAIQDAQQELAKAKAEAARLDGYVGTLKTRIALMEGEHDRSIAGLQQALEVARSDAARALAGTHPAPAEPTVTPNS